MAIQQSPLRELALFAGAGGGILGGHLLGWRTICAVERDAYAASVLVARQNDKILPIFPIWSDVTTFDATRWRGRVDVISGGFPCQDISAAGKGAGIDGARSGLWGEFARIIGDIRPRFVFVENSPMLTSRGLGRVLGDLASMGYDARWCVLGADDVGAPHQRKRIWILGNLRNADNNGRITTEVIEGINQGSNPRPQNALKAGQPSRPGIKHGELGEYNSFEWRCSSIGNPSKNSCKNAELANTLRKRCDQVEQYDNGRTASEGAICAPLQRSFDRGQSSWWQVEPELGRVADGVAHRVDRLRAIGNGQVSSVAATAWNILTGEA